MKLERVDISGFKSFGEKVELTFHRGMTAIVGPNGCGKSNISDAIGWVLGEQSAKSLRGQKMEDVIFNGSQNRLPMSLAQVDLRVSNVNLAPREDGGDKKAQRGEVVITRRLDRSGGSEYLIDGVLSRLRDVQELFMGTGVGSRAYAIIEQGKIGLILSSKPTDRRMLIEEAAGITKYKSRRRAAELKLQAAQQNLFRVNDIVYEITRQMNSLKRQAGKARRYRRLRDALDRLDKVVSVKRARLLDAKLAETRARLAEVSDEELRRSTSLATTETFLERARLRESEQELSLSDTKERLHQLELAIERLDQTVERDKQQLVELSERMEQLDVEAKELEERRGPVLERLAEREREEGELARELEGRESEAAEKQNLLKQAAFTLAEMESSIEERRSEIVHRISKIAALHNFLQGVLANADKVSAELLKLDEEVREVDTESRRLEASAVEVGKELEARRAEAELLAGERHELEATSSSLRAELEELDASMASEKEKLSGLSARLDSLQELVSSRTHFGVGARLILTRGAERGIQVLGSVSDAIEVDENLERAAEAFFDSALQRVHVREEQDVDKARELLREDPEAGRSELQVESLCVHRNGDLGPALETLRSRGVPGLVGRLSDGVRSVTAERPLLPDAIVMETYEDALRAFRETPAPYVTVKGEVLLPPGIVILGSGGAGEGLLATRREIRELEEAVAAAREGLERSRERRSGLFARQTEASAALERLRERQHALDKELVGVEHRRSQIEEERTRASRKCDVLASERERLVSERASLGAKKKEMEDSLESEETRKDEAEAALESLRGQLSQRRDGVEDLQATAAEAQSRLAALRERRDALRLDVERLREGVSELTSRVEAHRREQAALVERKAALGEGIDRAGRELETSLASRGEAIERGRALEEQLGRSRARVDATETALKLRRRELQEIRERRGSQEVALAKVESDLEHLRSGFESSHQMTLGEAAALLSPVEMQRDDEAMAEELSELKRKLDAIGPVNPMADEEYRELETRHEFVTRQRQDLLDSIEGTETAIGRIDRTSRQRFREAFEAINQEFGVTFKQLFGGGTAGLRLVDETDLLESGIDIIAQPPGKKLQNVLLLSGGEKAMTAIALLFAIFRYRPSPFCLLDEVDAPLDDANVGRFLGMLRELRDTTQFIVITHNRKTMEMADQLYGVTMEEPGISKLVSVSFAEGRPSLEEAVAT